MVERNTDIDKEAMYWRIMSWINYFGYEWVDCGQLIEYIKDNYTQTQIKIVKEYVNVMKIRVPSIHILDWDKIVELDDDYVSIGEDLYLNIWRLEHEEDVLRKEGLIE